MSKRPEYTRTNVEIETELLEKFRSAFPQHGSIKWFMNRCFRKFFELHDFDPDEAIMDTVNEVVRELKEDE